MPATGFEPIIFRLWVLSYTTVLPLLTIHTLKKVFTTIFYSLVPAEGFEPITFGLRVECTATVLPLLTINILKTVFSPFAHCQCQQRGSNQSSLDYKSSIVPLHYHTNTENCFFTNRFHPMPAAGFEPIIYELWVECYTSILTPLVMQAVKTVLPPLTKTVFCTIFSLLLPAAGLKPIIWVECYTTVLLLPYMHNYKHWKEFFHHLLSTCSSDWVQTNHLWIMSQALFHCVTTTDLTHVT